MPEFIKTIINNEYELITIPQQDQLKSLQQIYTENHIHATHANPDPIHWVHCTKSNHRLILRKPANFKPQQKLVLQYQLDKPPAATNCNYDAVAQHNIPIKFKTDFYQTHLNHIENTPHHYLIAINAEDPNNGKAQLISILRESINTI